MKDLSTITLKDFEDCLGQTFTATPEDGEGIELELFQAKPLATGDPEAATDRPFSVLFRGPLEPLLSQQMHRIENSTFGELSLFLVPIGPDENAWCTTPRSIDIHGMIGLCAG